MQTLLDLFKEFEKRGEKELFIYRTGVRRFSYSYAWLFQEAQKFANLLKENNISKGDKVLLWAPNSPYWAVCFWGTILRGAVLVPVDFISGKERAEVIKKMSGAELVIQSHFKIDRFGDGLIIEDLEYELESFTNDINFPNISPYDLVELVYTSGTTGTPKGVMLTHKNLIANLKQVNKHITIGKDFRFLSLLPLSHMFEQMAGFLTPFYKNCSIVFIKTLKPSSISKALKKENIYVVIAVPRLLQLLKTGIERELKHKHLDGVIKFLQDFTKNKSLGSKKKYFFPIHKKFGKEFKFFVSGGGALSVDIFDYWKSLGFIVLEGYGLTECSPVVAANTLEKQTAGSVGKVLPGNDIKIEKNEILVKGDNIFSGYYENQKATSEAFDNQGYFKTGDLGNIDKKGNISIKGRIKELIVTSAGINVYPDDLEPILSKIEGVKEVCVVGLDKGNGEEVHASLILEEDFQVEDIIKKANEKLDSTQQITSFSVWPELDFPKTTTMKIKKFEVKEKLLQDKELESSSQDKLINIISKITTRSVSEINDSSNLVSDLGLESIARLELINVLEQEFRLDLDDSIIDQKTKVQDLRNIIKKREKIKTDFKSRFWVHNPLIRIFRRILVWPVFLLLMTFAYFRIEGRENLKNLKGPVVFIANHLSYIDGPCVVRALPRKIRYNISPVVYDEFFIKKEENKFLKIIFRLFFEYVSILGAIFLISQKQGFRRALNYMGKLIDHKINILFFPEGSRSWDGKLREFRPGLGIIIKELKVPVVPIKLEGPEKILPRGSGRIKPGKVIIKFGKPLEFTTDSPSEIVDKAKQAIINL